MITSIENEIEILAFKGAETLSNNDLYNLLFDEDCRVRSIVAKVLQIKGDGDLFKKIVSLERDDRPFVRELCAFILGQYGTPDKPYKDLSVNTLISLTNDSCLDVKLSAVAALGHLYNDSIMPDTAEDRLFTLASDGNSNVRMYVALALGSCANINKAKDILLNLLQDNNKEVIEWAEVGLDILLNK